MISSIVHLLIGLFGVLGCFSLSAGAQVLSWVALATHILLWWQVGRGWWAMGLTREQYELLLVVPLLWLLVLMGFQTLCLLCWLEPLDSLDIAPHFG